MEVTEKKLQDNNMKEATHIVREVPDQHDARDFDVYGDEEEADIKYRTLVWWKAAALMLAETVSLGILSLPSVFASLGMVAGIILVIGLGLIATATGYVLGMFKLRYPHVHNMADVGYIIAGPIGREVLGAAQIIFIVFVCGSHVLTGLIAFDTITAGASCSVLWAGISAIICMVLTIPRTLDGISYLSVASFISIMSKSRWFGEITEFLTNPVTAAVLITMIGVGVAGHTGTVRVTADLSFASGFLAVTDIDFAKALFALQISDTTLYLVCGIVVYAYVGENATSPALGNTGVTLRKIAFGIALPTIMIAGVINGHVCAKMDSEANRTALNRFRRNGKDSHHMTSHTAVGWATWVGICVAVWAAAFIIAEVIPFFNDLLGVISAIFASWFTYGISGILWFHLTPKEQRWTTKFQKAKTIFWCFVILMGAFIMVAGLYSSIQDIVNGYRDGSFGKPFSCVSRAML
ncbi:hypothetical protein EIP86_010855 [Pleurotus ostreatoroseus]|nr:hypothetical protein EIP86_010855 [Pleurotus ostreatoroseus]